MTGHETPDEKLHRLMREAIVAGNGLTDPSIDAFVKALLAENDAVLIWELMADVRMAVVKRLFGVVHFQLRTQQAQRRQGTTSSTGGGRGHEIPETQHRVAPSSPVGAASPATVALEPTQAVPAAPHAPPRGATPTGAVFEAARQSWLDREWVNGKPIGDLTREEAEAAGRRNVRTAKFIELLVAQIPPNSNMPIREFISPDEADRYWEMAQEQSAA